MRLSLAALFLASTLCGCGETPPPDEPVLETQLDPGPDSGPAARGKQGRGKTRKTKPPLSPTGSPSSGFSEL